MVARTIVDRDRRQCRCYAVNRHDHLCRRVKGRPEQYETYYQNSIFHFSTISNSLKTNRADAADQRSVRPYSSCAPHSFATNSRLYLMMLNKLIWWTKQGGTCSAPTYRLPDLIVQHHLRGRFTFARSAAESRCGCALMPHQYWGTAAQSSDRTAPA